jgi:Na+-transporting NADH:ubiquinone oxidoreductase subunit B
MNQTDKKQPIIRWQKPMVGVVTALVPAAIASIYFFGWRSLLVLASVSIAGFICEYVFLRTYYKEPVSSAVFVTCFIFALSLPPTIPIWIAVVGIVFGVVFGKMVFGGFGKNVFNPAMTGRAFIYISFGGPMTSLWAEPFKGFPGGFGAFASDAVTRATPMYKLAEGLQVSKLSLFLGNISGSLGETSALLLILGGIYIIWKKWANYRIVASCFIGMLVPQTLFWLFGLKGATDPLSALLAGATIYGYIFVATDPVSAGQTTNTGRWIYGGFIGVLTSIIRVFSIWSGGIMFAVLLGNMFAHILDFYLKQAKRKGVS